jgi:hypothetical protein
VLADTEGLYVITSFSTVTTIQRVSSAWLRAQEAPVNKPIKMGFRPYGVAVPRASSAPDINPVSSARSEAASYLKPGIPMRTLVEVPGLPGYLPGG